MKLCVVFGVLATAEAAVLVRSNVQPSFLSALEERFTGIKHTIVPENGVSGGIHYGDTACPCIGFDNIQGSTVVKLDLSDGKSDFKKSINYPADLGARCEAWDHATHPACNSKWDEKPGWCEQRWCLVDPCNCDIDILPKQSVYLPTASYMGKPLFYSYATCGGEDFWMDPDLVPVVGKPKCRCIGFADAPGVTEVAFSDNKVASYPGDLGSQCKAWDNPHHPACVGRGEHKPAWCKANWCYVDPCDCELEDGAVPKISAYLPEATFTGKNLYYSYETCKSEDTWTTKHNKQACVNQKTEGDCGNNPRCAWAGKRCLGTELVNHPLCVAETTTKKSGAAAASFFGATCVAAAATAVFAQ